MITAPDPGATARRRSSTRCSTRPRRAVRRPMRVAVARNRSADARRALRLASMSAPPGLSVRPRVPGYGVGRSRRGQRPHPPGQIVGQQREPGLERGEVGQVGRIIRPPHGDQDLGQHVDGVAQGRHLELDRHLAQLLDRPGPAGVAPGDVRHRLAAPLGEGGVERVLQDGRVAVVVLAGQDEIAVATVDHLAEAGHRVALVVPPGPGRRLAVEERQLVVAQVDQLHVEGCVLGQPRHDPGGHQLAEAALAGGSGDDLHEHGALLLVVRERFPLRCTVANARHVFNLTAN